MKTVTAIEYSLSIIPDQVIDLYINWFVQQYQMIMIIFIRILRIIFMTIFFTIIVLWNVISEKA